MENFVTIDLEKNLQSFLMHEFKTEDGLVKLNSTSDIGKYILSMVSVTDLPDRGESYRNPVKLALPYMRETHYQLQEQFCKISRFRQAQIRCFLQAEFHLRIKEFFYAGRKRGYGQDIIITAFMDAYDIKPNSMSYDMLKQFDYRHRRQITREAKKEIQLSLNFNETKVRDK